MINKKHTLICVLMAGFIFTLPACSKVSDKTDTQVSTSATSTRSSNYKAPDFPDGMDQEPPEGMGFDISNEDIFEALIKPLKSHLPPLKSRRSDGIDGKTPQDIVFFGTCRPQDMGICKELE